MKVFKIQHFQLRRLASFSVCLAAFSCIRIPPAELPGIYLVCYTSTKPIYLGIFLFVFCWKGVGQSSKSSAFWWWQAVISGQLSARHSVTQGMNPWSQVWCSCCWEGVQCDVSQMLTGSPDSYNSWPLMKREKRVYVVDISQGYFRKACLWDWVLCQRSLKTLFKLVKWSKPLRLYWTTWLSWHCVSAWVHIISDLSLSGTCTSPTCLEGSGFSGASEHVKEASPDLCSTLEWALLFLQCRRDGLGGVKMVCSSPHQPLWKCRIWTQSRQVSPEPSWWGAQHSLHLMAPKRKVGQVWTTWAKSKRRQQSSEPVQQQRKRMTACRTSLFTEK